MAGPVRLRFSAHLPANTPVHPRKPPPKSFVKKTLPVSHTCGRTCAQIPAILMKTRNFRVEGEGGPLSDIVSFWESLRSASKSSRRAEPNNSSRCDLLNVAIWE